MSRLAKQLKWFYYFNLPCSVLNYIRIALTLVVIEHCASNVRLILPDIQGVHKVIRQFKKFITTDVGNV